MNCNDQDRHCVVILSAAKGLSRWAERSFPFATLRASAPALRMTGLGLIVTIHYRAATNHVCATNRLLRRSLHVLDAVKFFSVGHTVSGTLLGTNLAHSLFHLRETADLAGMGTQRGQLLLDRR